VCNVELIVLNFVIWSPVLVFALAVFVVTASVLEATPMDGRCDGCCVTNSVIVA
jgi:hypothetical protein